MEGRLGLCVQAEKEAARGPVSGKKKNAEEEEEEADPTVSGGGYMPSCIFCRLYS